MRWKTYGMWMLAGLLLAAGCGRAVQPAPGDGQAAVSAPNAGGGTLTVAIFGGSWGDAIKKWMIQPFEQQYGVKVNVVEGTSTVTLSKLKQEQNAPTIDIALMDSGVSEAAYQEGLVQAFDFSSFANAASVVEEGVQKDGSDVYGVALGYWGLGLAYNPEKVKNPPASWLDLWNQEYEGVVTVPTPATTGGLPFLLKVNELKGGSAKDVDAGFDHVKTLKTVAYFNGSGAASNLFQSGEAWVGAHYSGPAWALKDQGIPIEVVIPKEGVLGAGSFFHLVKGAPNPELALKFLDWTVSKEAQQGVAEEIYLAPVNKDVQLSEKALSRMPYPKGGSIKDISLPDYGLINQHRGEWTERWNKEIGNP